jgi:predicted CoA-binding protein
MIPVNPGQAGHDILGQTVYARLADVPEPVDMVDIFGRRNMSLPLCRRPLSSSHDRK